DLVCVYLSVFFRVGFVVLTIGIHICNLFVDSGLWGWPCKSSMIARENCALRCLSPSCYELIYESDPLEEGEKDFIRSQEYKYCMHKLSMGETLEGVKGAFGQ
ncbi:hypothetical protein KIW84_046216, partial [Lathyrus oleraceus]